MFEGKLDKEGHNASKVFLAHKRIQDQENLQGRQASKGVPDSNQDLAKSRFEEGIWGEQGGGTGGQRAVNRGFRVGSNQPSERVALHPTIFTVQYWHCTWCSTENTLLHLVADLCSRPRQWFFSVHRIPSLQGFSPLCSSFTAQASAPSISFAYSPSPSMLSP